MLSRTKSERRRQLERLMAESADTPVTFLAGNPSADIHAPSVGAVDVARSLVGGLPGATVSNRVTSVAQKLDRLVALDQCNVSRCRSKSG